PADCDALAGDGSQDGQLIAAGGFDDDERVLRFSQTQEQRFDATWRVVKALDAGVVIAGEIEEMLSDIDTESDHGRTPIELGSREHSRRIPALSVRTIVGQLFGRRREKPVCGALLANGRETPRETGTHAGLSTSSVARSQEIKRKATPGQSLSGHPWIESRAGSALRVRV